MYEYNSKYNYLKGNIVSLNLIRYSEGNKDEIPYYWYEIIENISNNVVGKISIRLGYNYHSYFNGNIGYEIDENYRGNNYAYIASKMAIEVAKDYGMKEIYLTCDEENIASYSTIEKLGAELVEIANVPKDYFGYYEFMSKQRIYKLITDD